MRPWPFEPSGLILPALEIPRASWPIRICLSLAVARAKYLDPRTPSTAFLPVSRHSSHAWSNQSDQIKPLAPQLLRSDYRPPGLSSRGYGRGCCPPPSIESAPPNLLAAPSFRLFSRWSRWPARARPWPPPPNPRLSGLHPAQIPRGRLRWRAAN